MTEKTYLLPEKAYAILKWVGLVFCPALAVLVSAVAPAWGYDAGAIVTTINAIGVFIGAAIGVSQATSKTKEE